MLRDLAKRDKLVLRGCAVLTVLVICNKNTRRSIDKGQTSELSPFLSPAGFGVRSGPAGFGSEKNRPTDHESIEMLQQM